MGRFFTAWKEKTETSASCPAWRPPTPGAGHVGGVEDQLQAPLRAERAHLGVPAGVPAHADEADRPRARRDPRRDLRGVEAEVLVHVGEDRPQVLVEDRVVGGDEGEGRRDHLVPVLPSAALPSAAGRRDAAPRWPSSGSARGAGRCTRARPARRPPSCTRGRSSPSPGTRGSPPAPRRCGTWARTGGWDRSSRLRRGPARAGRTGARRRLRRRSPGSRSRGTACRRGRCPPAPRSAGVRTPERAGVAHEQGEGPATPGRGCGARARSTSRPHSASPRPASMS